MRSGGSISEGLYRCRNEAKPSTKPAAMARRLRFFDGTEYFAIVPSIEQHSQLPEYDNKFGAW